MTTTVTPTVAVSINSTTLNLAYNTATVTFTFSEAPTDFSLNELPPPRRPHFMRPVMGYAAAFVHVPTNDSQQRLGARTEQH